nr:alpha-latrotoxin-Lt1a-like [Aegilops tauschii subsp. strangulata]
MFLTGRTPLFFAIVCYHAGTAKYLLHHGANPNIFNINGLSPLHKAAVSGTCESVKQLIAKGAYIDPVAYIDQVDFCGTPLHCAATKGHDDIMKILLDHNADCNKLVNGKTPLIAAIDATSRNCMVLLIEVLYPRLSLVKFFNFDESSFYAGADRMGALTYAMENLHSEKLVSTDFVNYIMEDVAANRFVPDDDEPESRSKTKAEGFKKLADCSFKQEDYLSAAKSYTVAIRFNPKIATLYSNRSLCWLRMGESDKAPLDAYKCRKLRSDWPKAYYRQGAALMLLKDYKGAREHFSDGLKLDPANTEMEHALRYPIFLTVFFIWAEPSLFTLCIFKISFRYWWLT